ATCSIVRTKATRRTSPSAWSRRTGHDSSGASATPCTECPHDIAHHTRGRCRMNFDPDAVAKLIATIAAEEIVPRFAQLGADDIVEKSPGDFVTVADLASEKRFAAGLPDLLPGSVVLGEEAVAKDVGLLSMLDRDEPVWVVDPLDGT